MNIAPRNAPKAPAAPAVGTIWRSEMVRVSCPYCHVGGAMFEMLRAARGPGIQVDTNRTVKCDTCVDGRGRPCEFKVQPTFGLRGVGLDYRHKRVGLEKDPRALLGRTS